jgi:hypothetical protein
MGQEMRRVLFLFSTLVAIALCVLCIGLPQPSLAQEWQVRVKPRGTLNVVDLDEPDISVLRNYAEAYVPY